MPGAPMKLHEKWREIARHSWSFWLAIALAIGEAVQAGFEFYAAGRVGMAAATSVASLGIAVARVVHQEKLSGGAS